MIVASRANAAGLRLNDLRMFDPARLQWFDLSGPLNGAPPPPRDAAGLAVAAGRMYVFGGYGEAGATALARVLARVRACACAPACDCACALAALGFATPKRSAARQNKPCPAPDPAVFPRRFRRSF